VLCTTNVDKATAAFNRNVLSALDKHAPSKRQRVKHSNPPWVNEHLLTSIKERDYLKKVAARTKSDHDWAVFKNKRNSVNKLKNQLKHNYFQETLSRNKQNTKKTMEYHE